MRSSDEKVSGFDWCAILPAAMLSVWIGSGRLCVPAAMTADDPARGRVELN